MQVHELKTWPDYFEAVIDGRKTFEVRRDDRGFVVGDQLQLREWNPRTETYTGRQAMASVSYILHGDAFGIEAQHVVMGLRGVEPVQ